MCPSFRDDMAVEVNPVAREIHAYAYEPIYGFSGAFKFLNRKEPSLENSVSLERLSPGISKLATKDINKHIMDRANKIRRETFKQAMKDSGKSRDILIYRHVEKSMTGYENEIFFNEKLTVKGIIPINWISHACVNVMDATPSKKAELLCRLMGPHLARPLLLQSCHAPSFEVANCISPIVSSDLFYTSVNIGNVDDFDPVQAEQALYQYMKKKNVPPPNFVTTLLHNSATHVEGFVLPKLLVGWALEEFCEKLCCGESPRNNASICEVIDFIVKHPSIYAKDDLISWVNGAVREGMNCGLADTMCATDKFALACFRQPFETEDDEATSSFRGLT